LESALAEDADAIHADVIDAERVDADAILDDSERQLIDAAMQELRTAMTGHDVIAIRAGIQALNESSEPYAARRMNASVQKALAGKRIDDVTH
jgi:molecular chaperone HscA